MKLTLIRPNLGDFRSSDAMPPLAMGILAARAPGWDITFFDEKVERLPEDDRPDLAALVPEAMLALPRLDANHLPTDRLAPPNEWALRA